MLVVDMHYFAPVHMWTCNTLLLCMYGHTIIFSCACVGMQWVAPVVHV